MLHALLCMHQKHSGEMYVIAAQLRASKTLLSCVGLADRVNSSAIGLRAARLRLPAGRKASEAPKAWSEQRDGRNQKKTRQAALHKKGKRC
jgi:hypothetical protein